MSRPPKIPKELILQASFDLLINEGYAAVTIKTIAKKLNCSTQPISWHFGSMNALRVELLEYALQYAKKNYSVPITNPFYAFYLTGKSHINMALKAPHLFRFLYMGESGMQINKEYPSVTYSAPKIAEFLGISIDEAIEYIQTMLFYTHGISSMIVNDTINETADHIFEMIDRVAVKLLVSYGIPHEIGLKLIKPPVNESSNAPT